MQIFFTNIITIFFTNIKTKNDEQNHKKIPAWHDVNVPDGSSSHFMRQR